MSDHLYYSILYSVIGDIIGYGNGDVEFNYGQDMTVKNQKDIEKLSGFSTLHINNFISNGSLNNYNFKNYIVSDDTILILAVLNGLIESKNKNEDIIVSYIKKSMISYYQKDDMIKLRNYGLRTIKSFNKIIANDDSNSFIYSSNAGGSGASMRCMPIGLIYYGEHNREKLIYISIMSSLITHANPIGFLGGLASALFTAYAIEKIDPNLWPSNLLKILNSKYLKSIIDIFIDKKKKKKKNIIHDLQQFKVWWKTYILFRFEKKKFLHNSENNQISSSMRYFDIRSRFYYDNFTNKKNFNPGSNGCDSVIIAYDCFMDSKSFYSLIFYSMLHSGDSDTTGCIAGAFYGAYHGNIDKLNINKQNIEKINTIETLFNKII